MTLYPFLALIGLSIVSKIDKLIVMALAIEHY